MAMRESGEITRLLRAWADGDVEARDELFPLVLEEARTLARRALNGERDGHTLQPTALVSEACLRLLGRDSVRWENRGQFFRALADIMRQILVDCARRRLATKRGGDAVVLRLDDLPSRLEPSTSSDAGLVALDEALDALADFDPEAHQVVTLRFFMGLKQHEIADVMDLSVNTVGRRWTVARKWLRHELHAVA